MLVAVLVIYAILFRRLKPYHGIQWKRLDSDAVTNGGVVELDITNHNTEQETTTATTVPLEVTPL